MLSEPKKPRILILIDWFAPGYKAGGPIQSSLNVALALKNNYEVFVLTTDTDHGDVKPYDNVEPNKWIRNIDPDLNVYYAKKASLTLGQLKREMIAVNADYIYLNHMFSPRFVIYPIWLKYRGSIKNKIIVCPRGALYDSALAVKPYKKQPFLKLFKWLKINKQVTFHATNDREKAAIERFFPASDIVVADNLPKTFQPPFETCVKEPGLVKCVFIARIHPIKNLLFLLKALQKVQGNVQMSIVGPLEDEAYWKECLEVINILPASVKVTYLGSIQNEHLAEIIKAHHIFTLPTTGENFGHSIFEALLAGRPVLISDQTPWLGLTDGKVGWDLPLNEPAKFAEVIEEACKWDQPAFDEWAKSAWNYASFFIKNPSLYQRYFELFS